MKTTSSSGFTLLEILIALMITGLVLGSLFTLLAGSKKLAGHTLESLKKTEMKRAVINLVEFQDENIEFMPDMADLGGVAKVEGLIEPPDRQTQKIGFALEYYSLFDSFGVRIKEVGLSN